MDEHDRGIDFNRQQSSEERQRRFIPQRYGGNYLALIIGLMLTFIFVAVLSSSSPQSIAARFTLFLFYATLFIGFRGTTRKLERNAIFGFAVAAAYGFDLLTTQLGDQIPDQLSSGLRSALVLVLMVRVLRDIITDSRVTIDTILGSVGVYFLLALAWTSLYVAINRGNPDAYSIPNSSGSAFADLLYFSVVTQTTLGYGDITPVSAVARQLAGIQAIVGQLYVAILVAWLVGIAASQYLQARQDTSND